FVLPGSVWDGVYDRLVARNHAVQGNLLLARLVNKLVAPRLAKAYLDRWFKRAPEVDLVFAAGGAIPRYAKPWVILLMAVNTLIGLDVGHLRRHARTIEDHFASPACRKIVIWWQVTREALLANFDCSRFEHKIEMVPPAQHAQDFAKSYGEGPVRLLFVGSANVPASAMSRLLGVQHFYGFDTKGGREALEVFRVLRERYPNVELVMRAGVPADLKRRFQGMPGLILIEDALPAERLAEEFKAADIFLYPSHQPLANTVLLEAMSYELPTVALDVYAYPEFVQDGVTGFLVPPSSHVPYYWERGLVSLGTPLEKHYVRGVKTPDPMVIHDLVERTSALIENPERRRGMGRAARWEIERGKHSLGSVNAQLKRIFDEALTV
ncbi:MAG TPA: glycosyltransferase, partial [Dehalococcoidia bacterium]|nr:glycosyltransferase [Dehalococcoidia bacterium]